MYLFILHILSISIYSAKFQCFFIFAHCALRQGATHKSTPERLWALPASIRSLRRRSCRNFIYLSLTHTITLSLSLCLSLPLYLREKSRLIVSCSSSSKLVATTRAHSQASSDLLFSYCSRLTFCLPLYRCCPCRSRHRCCCYYFSRRLASLGFVEHWVSRVRDCAKQQKTH